jgi:hypothetical protein
MTYSDGTQAQVGDLVELWSGCNGTVVCSLDTDEYTPAFPKEEWAYLQSGILIKTEKAGLLHYIQADEDLKLLRRPNQSI